MIPMRMQMSHPLRPWRRLLCRGQTDPAVMQVLALAGSFAAGFCLSAVAVAGKLQPVGAAILCAGTAGWPGLSFALGSGVGLWHFWGQSGAQALVWLGAALSVATFAGGRDGLLRPALSAAVVAVTGLVFQLRLGEQTGLWLYLLRIALAFGTTVLVQLLRLRRDPMAQVLAVGLGMLALGRIAPVPWLNLGVVAAGWLALGDRLAVTVAAGLVLDVLAVAPLPMTAVLTAAHLLGRLRKKTQALLPVLVYGAVTVLAGQAALLPMPALLVGGLLRWLEPKRERQPQTVENRIRQKLEQAAAVLTQTGQLLQQVPLCPPDEAALMHSAAQHACQSCDRAADCKAAQRASALPQALLHQKELTADHLPSQCRRKERLLSQIQRSQDQYRLLLADKQRQEEYRTALQQQYAFLAEYVQSLSDRLLRPEATPAPRFRPEAAACSRGREQVNGDRCLWFPDGAGQFYLLLCDGMGTGEGAAYEARLAAAMLRRMLLAGYPASAALQSLNSLCALRSYAGAVTVDLAQADLLTGRVQLYKWGAAPSWLLTESGAEQIGHAGPPPGLAVGSSRETVDTVSLHRGGALLLVSDGVDGEAATAELDAAQPAGFLATLVLEAGQCSVPDDATAAVLRLHPVQ